MVIVATPRTPKSDGVSIRARIRVISGETVRESSSPKDDHFTDFIAFALISAVFRAVFILSEDSNVCFEIALCLRGLSLQHIYDSRGHTIYQLLCQR